MINSIVLAEDNLEHCFFFRKAVKEVAPQILYTQVHDGDRLINLLESYLPDLLFLDLDMPCKNGVQCIKEIRENRAYRSMPIIVFTISHQYNTIQTTYACGANLYMIKPDEYGLLVRSLRQILTMDWSKPKTITKMYFQDNQYIPYRCTA